MFVTSFYSLEILMCKSHFLPCSNQWSSFLILTEVLFFMQLSRKQNRCLKSSKVRSKSFCKRKVKERKRERTMPQDDDTKHLGHQGGNRHSEHRQQTFLDNLLLFCLCSYDTNRTNSKISWVSLLVIISMAQYRNRANPVCLLRNIQKDCKY